MAPEYLPATQDVHALVAEQVDQLGGEMRFCFDNGTRLFLQALLPTAQDARPRDSVQAGIGVMVVDEEILVEPYTFRRVCSNGMMLPHALETRRIARVDFAASTEAVEQVTAELREALRASADPEVFSTAVGQMRSAAGRRADLALRLLPMLSPVLRRGGARTLGLIQRRFRRERDDSLFGLINAVTSVARDEPDPETRWRLEELGGALLAVVPPTPSLDTVAGDTVVV
jgi:hypothetical protein